MHTAGAALVQIEPQWIQMKAYEHPRASVVSDFTFAKYESMSPRAKSTAAGGKTFTCTWSIPEGIGGGCLHASAMSASTLARSSALGGVDGGPADERFRAIVGCTARGRARRRVALAGAFFAPTSPPLYACFFLHALHSLPCAASPQRPS